MFVFSIDNAAKATRVKRGKGRAGAGAYSASNLSQKPPPHGTLGSFGIVTTTSSQSHSLHNSDVALSVLGALESAQGLMPDTAPEPLPEIAEEELAR